MRLLAPIKSSSSSQTNIRRSIDIFRTKMDRAQLRDSRCESTCWRSHILDNSAHRSLRVSAGVVNLIHRVELTVTPSLSRPTPVRRVVVLNPKGGSGKTTLAVNTAGYFAYSGFQTVLMDCDPQGSSTRWLRKRKPNQPPIHGIATFEKDSRTTRSWQLRIPDGTERIVVDTPAAIPAQDSLAFHHHRFLPFRRHCPHTPAHRRFHSSVPHPGWHGGEHRAHLPVQADLGPRP